MSFIDRWFNKKKEAQLAGKPAGVKAEKKPEEKNTDKLEAIAPAAKAPVKTPITMVAHRVLVRPLITEKSAIMQSGANKFSFVVAAWATKGHVKQAVKEMYGIDALDVNVVNVQGRRVRFGRTRGRRSDVKKAIITLPKGASITIHEGV